jgi:hypothetical protein
MGSKWMEASMMALSDQTARSLRRAAANERRWLAKRNALIVQADAEGGSAREIARLAGLTHPGVLRILARNPEESGEPHGGASMEQHSSTRP